MERSYARKLWIYLGPKEWGNELMCQVAREAFANDTSLDVVQVNEHGGWYLTFLRDGTIVGTANDQAHLNDKAIRLPRQRSTATTRREKFGVLKPKQDQLTPPIEVRTGNTINLKRFAQKYKCWTGVPSMQPNAKRPATYRRCRAEGAAISTPQAQQSNQPRRRRNR